MRPAASAGLGGIPWRFRPGENSWDWLPQRPWKHNLAQVITTTDGTAAPSCELPNGGRGNHSIEHVFRSEDEIGEVDGNDGLALALQLSVGGAREHFINRVGRQGGEEREAEPHPRWGIAFEGRPLWIGELMSPDHDLAVAAETAIASLAWAPYAVATVPVPPAWTRKRLSGSVDAEYGIGLSAGKDWGGLRFRSVQPAAVH